MAHIDYKARRMIAEGFTCRECGCLARNYELHRKWHERIEKLETQLNHEANKRLEKDYGFIQEGW